MEIKREYGLGDIFYIDLWPMGHCSMVLSAPEIVAMPTTVNNAPQAGFVMEFYG